MDEEIPSQKEASPQVNANPLSTVTPLSKYLAMALFIVMPFLGGWIGYNQAPLKVGEVEMSIMNEIITDSLSVHEPIGESVYDWCIGKGGIDRTNPNFNEPLTCIRENKVYEDNCLSNDKYFIVRDSTRYAPGDFLVKRKESPDQTFACAYSVEPGDSVIPNSGADRLFTLEDDFLLISSATGPGPAGLKVYDLTKMEVIFSGSWMGPASINSDVLTYWKPTDIPATEVNCERYVMNQEYGLSSAIDEQVTFDLRTQATSSLGQMRCTARQ